MQLDPKLTWLAPGTPPQCADPTQIIAATQPWFQSHPSRQAFASRLLSLLISGPFPEQQSFCEALLVVEASHTALKCQQAQAGVHGIDVDRAREAAKKLLAVQRGNLGMWAAYAGLESQARQYKVSTAFMHIYTDAYNTVSDTATQCTISSGSRPTWCSSFFCSEGSVCARVVYHAICTQTLNLARRLKSTNALSFIATALMMRANTPLLICASMPPSPSSR